jgi:histidinol dehydrogenase
LVSGLAVLPKVSARNLSLKLNTVTQVKAAAAATIINYPAQFQGLAQSVLVDNQDAANPVTVRINRQTNTITIAAGNFRAFNDAWIEQLDLTGASTNTQVTSQVSPLEQISIYGGGVTN